MRNPLTIQVESNLGALFVSLTALFFIGLIFIAMKNFDSELTVIESDQVQIRNFKQ